MMKKISLLLLSAIALITLPECNRNKKKVAESKQLYTVSKQSDAKKRVDATGIGTSKEIA